MAFSPDSRRIASASDDGTARIWDVHTGHPLTPPLVHGKAVTAVEFSPDGTNVVTGDTNGAVRVWDAATGEPVTPFRSVRGAVESVEVMRTGMQFLAASEDDTKIWELHENSRSMSSISAISQLLSGGRLDAQVGSVAVDRNRLRECWRDYNRK